MKFHFCLCFFCLFLPLIRLGAELPVAAGVTLTCDCTGRDGEYLRTVLRRVERLARKAKVRRPAKKLRISLRQKEFRWLVGRQTDDLLLPGDSLQWRRDEVSRQELFAVLLACRFGLNRGEMTSGMPYWIVAGLDLDIRYSRNNGFFLANNRNFPALSAFADYFDRLPSFSLLADFQPGGDPLLSGCLSEQALLLLEIWADGGQLPEVLRSYCGETPPQWLDSFRRGQAPALDRHLQELARKRLFRSLTPPAAGRLLADLARLREVAVPAVNDQGEFTGEIRFASLADLSALLQGGRQESLEFFHRYRERWLRFAAVVPPVQMVTVSRISAAVSELPEKKEAPQKIAALLDELQRGLQCWEKQEKYLAAVADNTMPLSRFYRYIFPAVSGISALTAEQSDYLDQISGRYLAE